MRKALMIFVFAAAACGSNTTSAPPSATPSTSIGATSEGTLTAVPSSSGGSPAEQGSQPATKAQAAQVLGLSPGLFDDLSENTADLMQQACDQGYVNPGYVIVVGGSWMLAGDYNEQATSWARRLNEAGVEARTIRYCDYG